jgi:hypothetical protein
MAADKNAALWDLSDPSLINELLHFGAVDTEVVPP